MACQLWIWVEVWEVLILVYNKQLRDSLSFVLNTKEGRYFFAYLSEIMGFYGNSPMNEDPRKIMVFLNNFIDYELDVTEAKDGGINLRHLAEKEYSLFTRYANSKIEEENY